VCASIPDGTVTCVASRCQLTCNQGLTSCEGGCVDATTDPAHCGDCMTQCKADEICTAGACVPTNTEPPPPPDG
jgi:hypothetical protein